MSFAPCTNESSCVTTRRRNLPSSLKVWVIAAYQPHPASNPSGTVGCRNLRRGWAAVSRTALPRSHGGPYDASHTQRRPLWNRVQESARHRGSGALGCTHSSQPAHPGDPRWSHSWPAAETPPGRLAAVIETATSTYLGALDDGNQATAKLYVQKAAQTADEAWQQTIGGLQGPGVTNPTIAPSNIPHSASQDEDSEDMDFSAPQKSRLRSPQFQARPSRVTGRTRLSRLKNTLLSTGAWQQVARIEEMCHTQVSHKWLYHLDACADSVLTPHDYITNVQKDWAIECGHALASAASAAPSWTHSWNTEKLPAPSKPLRMRCRCDLRLTICRSRQLYGTQGLTASQSRPADFFTTAAVPVVRLLMCV